MSDVVTTVDVIRHGEPLGGHKFRGHTDDVLSDLGWRQLWAQVPTPCPWQAVVTSPLRRCAAFAEALASREGIPLQIVEDFREMSFGVWDGRAFDALQREQPAALSAYFRDPLNALPPGAELPMAVQARVVAAWTQLLTDYAGKTVLLVAHGGVIRLLFSHLLAMPLTHLWRIDVPFACLSRVVVYGAGDTAVPVLHTHRQCPPLPPPSD